MKLKKICANFIFERTVYVASNNFIFFSNVNVFIKKSTAQKSNVKIQDIQIVLDIRHTYEENNELTTSQQLYYNTSL